MLPGTYDITSQYAGDTFDGLRLTLTKTENGVTTPIDLTGATVTFHLNALSKSGTEVLNLTGGDGITVESASAGVVRIDPFSVPLNPGVYFYAVRVLFPLNVVKTYVEGKFPVVERVK
jgi:hypothetical protein